MQFAIRTVNLYKYLVENRKEYVLSKQLLRSGTSIGANIREAQQAESDKDFIHKLSIALKESTETEYWLELLFQTEYLKENEYTSIIKDCQKLKLMLVKITKNKKKNMGLQVYD
ncbi:MAG: four helix bundle protein [Candidatus Cloacimonetes bacterium]|nr:four helix bundle protein [Candidatus Cloacimonadota bacterium]